MYYRVKKNLSIYDITDGRLINWVAKDMKTGRERLSKVLRGVEFCDRGYALRIIERCQPNKCVEDYFDEIK